MHSVNNISIKEKADDATSVRFGNRLMMVILFIVSGNPAMSFGLSYQPFYAATAMIFFFILFRQKNKIMSHGFFVIFPFFAFILLYQSYSFSFLPVITILGFFIRLFIAYAIVRLIKDFARTYVDVIYALSLLSFLFYIPQQVGNAVGFNFPDLFPSIETLFSGERLYTRKSIFFHTFYLIQDMNYRNSGPFWEPGAFAGYIIMGIIFLSSIKNQYDPRAYWKRLIVLSLCLLSTFSTTSYIVFPLAIMLHVQLQNKAAIPTMLRFLSSIYIVFIFGIFFFTFVWEQHFMKEKILNSIMVSQYKLSGWEVDRIGTIFFDFEYIQERPFTGWGLHEDTRLSLHPFLTDSLASGRGNGMSDFAARMGLPALILWMYFVFKYLFFLFGRNLIKSGIGLLCLMIVLNGECYLNYPLFMCFFFLMREVSLEKSNDSVVFKYAYQTKSESA